MEQHYILINNQLIPYNNEPLKKYVGKKLIQIVSNPDAETLKDFGYKTATFNEQPTFDEETQYLDTIITENENGYVVSYIIKNLQSNKN